ncbi:NB-ARC domain-containing protein [Asanoa sp. NPDC049518]|uniref:NB-ARC domain-containing protein n=1 Tax=unclassified Asanoa TaxID=2685164 RepID=UPI00343649B5
MSRPPFTFLVSAGLLVLTGWVAVVAFGPESTRLWTALVLAISVALMAAQVRRLRQETGRPVSAPPALAAAYLVPSALPPAKPLVGRRSQVEELTARLREASAHGPTVIQASGRPGVGKTALALAVAHRAADAFPDGRLFASCADGVNGAPTATVPQILEGFIDALQGPGETITGSLKERIGQFRAITRTRKRILIVLDDVSDPEMVAPLLPSCTGSAVIITTRLDDPLVALHRHVTVDPLDEQDSTELLRSLIGAERVLGEQTAAHEIVKRTNGSPLALHLAAGSLGRRRDWTLSASVRTMREAQGGDADQHTLDLSFALLTERERQAVRHLGTLPSRFDPWMLSELLDDTDERGAWQMCERLVHARLLEQISDDPSGVASYRILDHVHDYARGRGGDEASVRAAQRRLRDKQEERSRRDIARILREDVYQRFDLGELSHALNHARAALALARENLVRSNLEDTLDLGRRQERAARARGMEALALAALAEALAELGGVTDAADLAEKAIASGSRAAEARGRRSLGRVQRRQHHFDAAMTTLEAALALAVAEDDHAEATRTRRELALTHGFRGDTGAALEGVDHALEEVARRAELEHLRASLLWARGDVLIRAFDASHDGDLLAEASDSLKRGAAAGDELGQQLWLAWIDYEHTRVARRRGQFDHARRFGYRAITSFTQMRHRYGTARCRLEVGRSYHDQGESQLALLTIEEARQTFSTCGDRWIEAHAALSLALVHQSLRRHLDARREARRASALFREVGDSQGAAAADSLAADLAGGGAGAP